MLLVKVKPRREIIKKEKSYLCFILERFIIKEPQTSSNYVFDMSVQNLLTTGKGLLESSSQLETSEVACYEILYHGALRHEAFTFDEHQPKAMFVHTKFINVLKFTSHIIPKLGRPYILA